MIGGRDYRTGTITIDQAREKFDEYYEKRTGSPLGLLRAKLFDMMYQKKSEKTIKCDKDVVVNGKKTKECEKGSVKYLLDEGPRTFDIEGVDSFPEDTDFPLSGKTYTSKGHSSRKSTDNIKKIYGPRRSSDKKLYAEHEKGVYKNRKGKKFNSSAKGFKVTRTRSNPNGSGNNLVDIYWEKFYAEKKKGTVSKKLARKNKKDKEIYTQLLTFQSGLTSYVDFVSLGLKDKKYSLLVKNDKLLLMTNNKIIDEDSVEYDYQIGYLQELGVLEIPISNKLKTTITDFTITIENEWDGKKEYYNLNIITGKLNKINKSGRLLTASLKKTYKTIYSLWTSKRSIKIPDDSNIVLSESHPIMKGGKVVSVLGYNFFD